MVNSVMVVVGVIRGMVTERVVIADSVGVLTERGNREVIVVVVTITINNIPMYQGILCFLVSRYHTENLHLSPYLYDLLLPYYYTILPATTYPIYTP